MNEISLVVLLLGLFSSPGGAGADGYRTAAARAEAARASLRGDLEQILRRGRFGSSAGVLVISLDQGDTLFVHRADSVYAPASNLKLFTSAAALHYLGPAFRYNTYLLVAGAVSDGVVDGHVVLYGTGDPTLSDRFGESVLSAFADSLGARGIREVRGDVVGDASYFGSSGVGIGWSDGYSNALYAAPASALSFAENIAWVEIRPATSAGGAPALRVLPGGDGLELVNRATTTSSGRTRVGFGRTGYEGPVTVTGTVSSRTASVRYPVPVTDPARFAAGAFREALERRGIVVRGGTRSVHSADGSVLSGRSLFAPGPGRGASVRVVAVHTSPPLLDVLEVINKRSHNFLAEQVLRTMGRVVLGDGSVEGGATAVQAFARSTLGLAASELQVFDGSGLSPLNRTTPGAMVQLLSFATHAPTWDAFLQTLPQTGASDGLRRMRRTAAAGRVWAKTGTIRNVSALSGYVRTAEGEMLAFSILNNRASSTSRAKVLEDQIVSRLAVFNRSAGEISGAAPASTGGGIR